jgi:hypothetical protein
MKWIDRVPLLTLVIIALTLGLAPFNPPHIWEKLNMLANGELTKPIDIFDLFLHATPWVLLIIKLIRQAFVLQKQE